MEWSIPPSHQRIRLALQEYIQHFATYWMLHVVSRLNDNLFSQCDWESNLISFCLMENWQKCTNNSVLRSNWVWFLLRIPYKFQKTVHPFTLVIEGLTSSWTWMWYLEVIKIIVQSNLDMKFTCIVSQTTQ